MPVLLAAVIANNASTQKITAQNAQKASISSMCQELKNRHAHVLLGPSKENKVVKNAPSTIVMIALLTALLATNAPIASLSLKEAA